MFRNEAKEQEDELARERAEADARLKALEEQVKQGKPQVVEVDVDIAKDSSDGTTLVEGSDSFDDYSSSEYEDD